MNGSSQLESLQVSVVCFPYFPSKDTGRGHDRYILELLENLQARRPGVRVGVVEQGVSKGVLVAGVKLFRLIADLWSERADVYHAISPLGGAALLLLGKVPTVVTVHDLIPFQVSGYDYSWKYRYTRFCTKLCVRRSRALIVPYRVTRDLIVSRLGGDAEKIHVVHYGVDHSTYHPRSELKRSARRVLYIGEVSRSKGVDVLIRAFSEVKRRVPDAELVIGGKSNKDQPALESLTRDLGVTDVVFRGFIPEDELATHYSTATVMVFPSRYGFGLSVLEAMACGTPVVVAAALDAPEFVADAGALVRPDDASDLADAIVRVLSEPALQEQFAAKGVERAKAFSWSNMAVGTAEVYARVRSKLDARGG